MLNYELVIDRVLMGRSQPRGMLGVPVEKESMLSVTTREDGDGVGEDWGASRDRRILIGTERRVPYGRS